MKINLRARNKVRKTFEVSFLNESSILIVAVKLKKINKLNLHELTPSCWLVYCFFVCFFFLISFT